MTHYDALGVTPDADASEIRRAFVAAARVAHPDAPTGNDERMRTLNRAWGVLGDSGARSAYDETLRDARRQQELAGPPINRPDATFTPHSAYGRFESEFDSEFQDPLDLDDSGDPASAPGRLAQVVPVALMVASMALGAVGLVVGLFPIVVMAFMLGVLGAVAFVAVPLWVMGRAAAIERAADLRRG